MPRGWTLRVDAAGVDGAGVDGAQQLLHGGALRACANSVQR